MEVADEMRHFQQEIAMLRESVAALTERVRELELRPARSASEERVAFPPSATGMLARLHAAGNFPVIHIPPKGVGNPSDLLTEGDDEWYSPCVPNSSIAWHLPHGIRMAIESVRMGGRRPESRTHPADPYGIVNFAIEGSSDNVTWFPIITSERNPPSFHNWVTEARIPREAAAPYPMIRLRQTGRCCRSDGVAGNDHLVLSYVDFGGTILYPPV
jgi:hypothetical protein